MADIESSLEKANREVKIRRALAVMEHRVLHGSTVSEACAICNVAERTFYQWVSDGVLEEYLDDCQKSRSQVARAIAAEAVPDIIRYQIELATGQSKARNANPVAAAQFVLGVAGLRERSAAEQGVKTAILAFLPEMVTFRVEHGALIPAGEILEGEIIDDDEAETTGSLPTS